jgi:hypothetical protein
MIPFTSIRSLVGRRPFAVVCGVALLGALSCVTMRSHAQLDYRTDIILVIYDGEIEVGRAFRDRGGAQYTEHWVLFPNYTFDGNGRPGDSIRIVAERGRGYQSVDEFLDNVPFPKGSRYVVTKCHEFDRLPGD